MKFNQRMTYTATRCALSVVIECINYIHDNIAIYRRASGHDSLALINSFALSCNTNRPI